MNIFRVILCNKLFSFRSSFVPLVAPNPSDIAAAAVSAAKHFVNNFERPFVEKMRQTHITSTIMGLQMSWQLKTMTTQTQIIGYHTHRPHGSQARDDANIAKECTSY